MMELTQEELDAANAVFRQPPRRLNCAQSVAVLNGREDLVEELQNCGGGRAPNGLCGALHAALLQAPPEDRLALRKAFLETVGAETCAEIKSGTRTPCLNCVACAAKLLKSRS